MSSHPLLSALGIGRNHHRSDRRQKRRLEAGRESLRLERLEDRRLPSVTATLPTPGTISGTGTVLKGQDSFNANVQVSVVGGVVTDSGTLSFSDSKAGDTFNAVTISSVEIYQAGTPVPGGNVSAGYFVITGTATLSTASAGAATGTGYSFKASGALPTPGGTNSTSSGGLSFQAAGPNGFSYSLPFTPWDPGETIAITVSAPVLIATTTTVAASPSPSVFGQPVTFTATVAAATATSTATSGTPSGSVTFSIDSRPPVTESLSGGKAVYQTTSLGVGPHSIAATYAGNTAFATSTGTTSQTTNQAGTTTYLSAPSSFLVGQPTSLTAAVGVVAPGAGKPTGSITFQATPVITPAPVTPPTPTVLGQVSLSTTSSTVTLSLPTGLPSSLSPGPYTITAVYSGDSNFTGSTSPGVNRTLEQFATATKLTTSVNPVVTGQPVTLTATVISSRGSLTTNLTAGPTGTVTFYDGATMLGTAAQALNSAGVAQLTLPSGFATGGPHSLKAVYSGDPTYATSSGTVLQSVLATTATTLASSVNPTVYGQLATFTATVTATAGVTTSTGTTTGGTPTPTILVTGSVNFLIDSKTTVTAPLSSGKAVYQTYSLGVGPHTIVATYVGTSLFATSTSQPVMQTVNQASTTTYLSVSGSFIVGQPVSLTAAVGVVKPGLGKPTGNITFQATPVITPAPATPPTPTTLGQVSLSTTSSTVTLSLPTGLPSSLSPGPYTITAVYSGDPNFTGSTSPGVSRTLEQIATATKLTTSVNPVVAGQPVTLTATVVASSASLATSLGLAPTGMVTFYDGTAKLGTASLSSAGNGQWSAQLQPPASFSATGGHSLQAVFSGDHVFIGSTGTLTETVGSTAATTHVSLATSASRAVVGQLVTFTAYVSTSTSPTIGVSGTVTLMDGNTPIASAPVTNDEATFTLSTLTAGTHQITASYSGDSNFTAGTSSTLTENIVLPTPGTISGTGTLLKGQDTFTVNVQATVTGGVPSYAGTLSFSAGSVAFTAASITSIQIYQYLVPQAGGSPAGTATYFTITGTATLATASGTPSNGTSTFVINGSLPVQGVTNSTGGLSVQLSGPNGFSYTLPFTPWDPGESIVVTLTPSLTTANAAGASAPLKTVNLG
jgi:hypothetical protein